MAEGITIDKVNIEIESNSSKATSSLDNLINTIKKMKGATKEGASGLDVLKAKLKSFVSFEGFNKLKTNVQNFSNKTVKNLKEKMNTAFDNIKKHWSKGDISKWLKLGAFFTLLGRIAKAVKGFVEQSAEYISVVNYFNTSMGKMKDTATEFANTMSKDFYLDPKDVMNYMASFNSLIKGFGIADDKAYLMSKNLTQLSYDMAIYYRSMGLTIQDAMQKIKSGVSGELEPMRAIGIALDQATLQQVAYELGIKKKVSTMTRAQKTELLYYQIMKSTTDAQGQFARTLAKTVNQLDGSTKVIMNPATAISILKQQFSQLGRAIGNIFIPILTKMIPYIMAATQVLQELAESIAAFFGFDIKDYDFGGITGGISNGIDGIGDSAEGATKKLKGMLAPFDELNTIDFGKGSGSGDDIIGGGSLGIELPEYNWTKNEELTKRVEEIKKKFRDILPIVEAIGISILGWKVGSTVINFLDKIGILDKTKWLKKALGLSLVLGGVWLQYNSIKKMINGDLSGATLGQFFMGAGMTALGTLLLTGSWTLAAGVALISFTVAWSLGLKEKFTNWLSNKIKKIFPTGIGFKWENGIPKVEINPIMLISFALQWGSRKKNEKEAKTIGESIVSGVAGTLTETALTATLGPRSR